MDTLSGNNWLRALSRLEIEQEPLPDARRMRNLGIISLATVLLFPLPLIPACIVLARYYRVCDEIELHPEKYTPGSIRDMHLGRTFAMITMVGAPLVCALLTLLILRF